MKRLVPKVKCFIGKVVVSHHRKEKLEVGTKGRLLNRHTGVRVRTLILKEVLPFEQGPDTVRWGRLADDSLPLPSLQPRGQKVPKTRGLGRQIGVKNLH